MEWNKEWNGTKNGMGCGMEWNIILKISTEIPPWQLARNMSTIRQQTKFRFTMTITYTFKGLVQIFHVGTLGGLDKAEYKYQLECGGLKAQSWVQLPLRTRFGSGNVKLSPCGE